MDPISHVAFGRTLVALTRSDGATRGTVGAAVLGSLAPDVDAVFMPFGWDRYLFGRTRSARTRCSGPWRARSSRQTDHPARRGATRGEP